MSDTATMRVGRLREQTAEEIRVLLARRRISATELARRTGMKQSTLARRMTGETAFDLDDLERISNALGVPVSDLLPANLDPNGRSADMAERVTPKRQNSPTRPPGRADASGARPQSPAPPSRRRPAPVGPPSRPMR